MACGRKRKREIEDDLEKNPNDSRYKLITPVTKKSTIWANFQQIEFEGNLENFARCKKCSELLSCSAKTGTGSLLRHKCSGVNAGYRGIRIQKLPTQQIHLTRFPRKILPESQKSEIRRQLVSFMAKDLRPINIIEGEGFQKFCQTLINIGAQYGPQLIKDLLTSKTHLERNLIPAEYDRIKKQLELILANNHLAFSTDTWTEDFTKRSFLTLNVHYINEDFNLKTNVLGTRELTEEIDMHDSVLQILIKFNITEKLKTGVIVTDNNPDVNNAAFRNYKHLSCACQNLNLAMEEALEKSNAPELKILIDESKKLQQFLINSGLNGYLTKPMERASTHWGSIYTMLTNILDGYTQIQQLLTTTDDVHKIPAINLNELQKFLDFLGPFKECSEQLSSEKNPTIHEYVLWFEKLIKHCIKNATDTEIVAKLKVYTASALKKRLQPSTLHNVAIFLNPPYKQLKFMSEDQRVQTMTTIKTMLEEHVQPNECKNPEMKKGTKPFNVEDQTSRGSIFEDIECSTSESIDLFDEFKDEYDEDDSNVSVKEIDTELQIYLKKKVNHCKILDFWKEAVDLPLLRSFSRQILNIPMSAVNGEKLFSTSARTLGERRVQLSSENVDKILFLNKNL